MIHIERCILTTKDHRPWPQEQAHEGRTGGAGRVGLKGIRNGQKGRASIEFAVASLPKMRRQDENTGPATHGAGRLSSVLPEVQIRLCDSFQRRQNRRCQNAGRIDAVQSGQIGLYSVCFLNGEKNGHVCYEL